MSGEEFYEIAGYDRMRPFFMSIVSACDQWMFISSTGALTAGRGDPDHALFPYYTDDKIHDSAETTGSKTVLLVRKQGRDLLWEPFSHRYESVYRLQRRLTKSFFGNKLIFEELNQDLGLVFRYGWFASERFGFVRRSWLANVGSANVRVRLLDGVQNLMPSGIGSQFQLEKGNLLDAYKRNELEPASGLGLFRLSSIPIDRPEPAESLRTTMVWSVGLSESVRLLSSVQLGAFRQGRPVREETDVRAERGAYFVQSDIDLPRGATRDWLIVADVSQGPSGVAEINRLLRRPARLQKMVEDDVLRGTQELRRIAAAADALQMSAEPLVNARHFSNVLFNVMRGGIFRDAYGIDRADLQAFVQHANRDVAARHAGFFRKLKPAVHCAKLLNLAMASGDRNLERLCREYLPLTFSRRHGDPSRPWNRFSIAARNAHGTRALNYEGNWRDIFQNWEALAVSFPGYTAGMICRFVNASTLDGYNAYRITRDGIDWETVDPADPWSHIGYWGDHQVIYLLKLLEILHQHAPSALQDLLTREVFCYANVPYRIKAYEQLLKDPKNTIVFDAELDEAVRRRVRSKGADGKLIWDGQGHVRLVNLSEKLLVSVLAKLSNFIPGAGIWLNTQRPEWNDANNALVGNGVSMVTLYYLRRYLAFCIEVFGQLDGSEITLSAEVARFLEGTCRILKRHHHLLKTGLESADRRRVLDELGHAGSRYRNGIYARGLSGRTNQVSRTRILDFFNTALSWVDESIRDNRRPDGLYHAYNLANFEHKGTLQVRRLYEMLEGQVAVLSSGRLSAEESLELLRALKRSSMYRADQRSYLLYPDRQLPRFTEKNNIPPREVTRSRLMRKLLADGNCVLVERDVEGRVHFNGSIMNARDVGRRLDELARAGYAKLVGKEAALVLDVFERLFDHQSFTGRSGTFYGYEGLGCIYWHMVSKLLLAVQETFFRAVDAGTPPALLDNLAECYDDIRAGMGDRKTPEEYGAFPMDPYSHTPGHGGARQPGLTGQVKEDILCRLGELGVFVVDGQIRFRPLLLKPKEFLKEPEVFEYCDVSGVDRRLRLAARSLAFTYCQVPIVYQLAKDNSATVTLVNGASQRSQGLYLAKATSHSIFERAGKVKRIEVAIGPDCLRAQ